MANKTWNIVIDMNSAGQSWDIALTASEESIITMLKSFYGVFESQLKDIASRPPGTKQPAGLIDDALVLLRCLVFNRLEAHAGRFLSIRVA